MSNSIQFRAISGARNEDALCYLLEIGEANILLDCGSFDDYNNERLTALKRISRQIDAVLLSHPDMAHLGAYPLAYSKYGLNCPVYSTIPVQNMGRLCLLDLVRSKRMEESFDLFDEQDVYDAFEHIIALRYSQPTVLSTKFDDIIITAHSAGHTIGGSIWTIQKDTDNVMYAVDYNHIKEQHLSSTSLLSRGRISESMTRPTVLITDAYNATIVLPRRKDRDQGLLNSIKNTVVQNKGNVLLPVDTSARVLELAYLLEGMWANNESLQKSAHLVLLNRCSRRVVQYAQSSLEWMADSIGHRFDQTRINPFEFKHIKLVQTQGEIIDIVESNKGDNQKSIVIMASFPGLETGHARRWLYEWANNENNMIFLTQRGAPGTLSRLLYDQWIHVVGDGQSLTKLPVSDPIHLDMSIPFQIKERVALEGKELEEWRVAESVRKENEEAQVAIMARNEMMIDSGEDTDDDDDDDSDMDAEPDPLRGNIMFPEQADGLKRRRRKEGKGPNAGMIGGGAGGGGGGGGGYGGVGEMDIEMERLISKKTYDIYVRDTNYPYSSISSTILESGNGYIQHNSGLALSTRGQSTGPIGASASMTVAPGLFKQLHGPRMFPNIQLSKRIDDYGELIDPAFFMQDIDEKDEEEENQQMVDINAGKYNNQRVPKSKKGGNFGSSNNKDDQEYDVDIDDYDAEVPSKYVSADQMIQLSCKLNYIDYDGRIDSRAISNILTLIAPQRLILVHGSDESTEHLFELCLRNEQNSSTTGGSPSSSPDSSNRIYAPKVDEIINVSSSSNTFTVKLTDNILNTMPAFTTIRQYDLAYMCGQLHYPEDSKIPVLNVPDQQLVKSNQWRNPLIVGSTKLTELKRALKANNIDSEFTRDGVLICNGEVAIHRTLDGKIKLQSNFSPTYYRIREIVYNQIAAL
ncbi:hypothetical protein H4219_006252 [Mycoemilia scoparia]|uniref:Cleavage and polyadenylation specificity factor subunit 2 n=1 Tax=Mycoemilia scoparia TaxID=417184 RepID=A0A9W8DI22_9FUNG|nr:hypothetical protein H4219_006252 [Mycoemilia scoparia]